MVYLMSVAPIKHSMARFEALQAPQWNSSVSVAVQGKLGPLPVLPALSAGERK
jgi:hypothetical protein